jgi:hypothetical protein
MEEWQPPVRDGFASLLQRAAKDQAVAVRKKYFGSRKISLNLRDV